MECKDCIFFDPTDHPKQKGEVQLGSCRQHAPTLVATAANDAAVWPVVRDWDWCGDFRPLGRVSQP